MITLVSIECSSLSCVREAAMLHNLLIFRDCKICPVSRTTLVQAWHFLHDQQVAALWPKPLATLSSLQHNGASLWPQQAGASCGTRRRAVHRWTCTSRWSLFTTSEARTAAADRYRKRAGRRCHRCHHGHHSGRLAPTPGLLASHVGLPGRL